MNPSLLMTMIPTSGHCNTTGNQGRKQAVYEVLCVAILELQIPLIITRHLGDGYKSYSRAQAVYFLSSGDVFVLVPSSVQALCGIELGAGEHQNGHDDAVQPQDFGKDEDEHHTDVQARLLRACAD